MNQEILSVTELCKTKTLYGQHGWTQLIFQASRHLDLFSTNTLFSVEQPKDSKAKVYRLRVGKRHHKLRWLFVSRAGWESPGGEQQSVIGFRERECSECNKEGSCRSSLKCLKKRRHPSTWFLLAY